MNEIEFGTLKDIGLRAAWRDEAVNFTPWLADNLDRLGSVVGLDLELIEAEAGLPSHDDGFSADILARNLTDDTNVLVENQLEGSDHRHLGQLLTYLAGLEARTVIWVARDFREAHLAAIKWLNENTLEEFAFFAIKLRVVQIGDSALAPLFDVLEKPNAWERRLQSNARAAKASNPAGEARRKFWAHFFNAFPTHSADGTGGAGSSVWHKVNGTPWVVSYFTAKDRVGLFIRGDAGVERDTAYEALKPHAPTLEAALGVSIDSLSSSGVLADRKTGNYADPAQYDVLCAWLDERIRTYTRALEALPKEPA
jgi:hypothetical protein